MLMSSACSLTGNGLGTARTREHMIEAGPQDRSASSFLFLQSPMGFCSDELGMTLQVKYLAACQAQSTVASAKNACLMVITSCPESSISKSWLCRGKAAKRGAHRQAARERGGSPNFQGIPLQCLCRFLHAEAGQALIVSMQLGLCWHLSWLTSAF